MNFGMVRFILGFVMLIEGVLMLIPAGISAYNKESSQSAFFIVMAILIFLGILLSIKKPGSKLMYAPEGFLTVTLSWLVMSFFGALPFFISGAIPSFSDAFFESVSGFTTTGATILSDIEALPDGLQFWRAFTHWIGGLGVLMFMLAIIPLAGGRSIFLIRAESSGTSVDKLVPRMRYSAMILYAIYFLLSFMEIVLLLCGGMNLFDSIIHTFSTAGTGGFSNKAASIAYYNSPYIEGVITVFMILFGVNFNVFFLIIIGKFKGAFKNEELKYYIGIIIAAVIIISINIFPQYGSVGEALRHSSFQVGSIISSTGFASADFNLWPGLSKGVLVVLMFIGSCAGSTGGGIKVSRIILLMKSIGKEIKCQLHPRSVNTIRFNGRTVEDSVSRSIGIYISAYFLILIASSLILSADIYGFEESVTASITCLSNIGPGLGEVGPVSSFAELSHLSKWVLSFDMLCGRLEIFPVLVAFLPSSWHGRIKTVK